ncbi:hypothetical protein LEMLEM_LOCUS21757 [Lemmus lemmus]
MGEGFPTGTWVRGYLQEREGVVTNRNMGERLPTGTWMRCYS